MKEKDKEMMHLSRALASLLISRKPPKKKFEVENGSGSKRIVATEHELEFQLPNGNGFGDQVEVNTQNLLVNTLLSTREISEKYPISMKEVRTLCRAGVIIGTQPKGPRGKWLVSDESVQKYLQTKAGNNGKNPAR